MSDKTAVGVIPARGGSERLKDKNTLLLCGKPLIAYTIEAALKAESLDRVIVSTDSGRIAEVAREWGAEVVNRPAELATSNAPIDEAVRHVISHLSRAENYPTDIAVLMQANLPIRADGVIDKVVAMLLDTGAETVATVYEVNQRPEWMKRLVDGRAVPCMTDCRAYRNQDLEKLYLVDGAVVAIKVDTLMRTGGDTRVHAFMGQDVCLVIQDRIYSIEVDGLDDMRLAENILQGMISGGR